LPEEFVLFFCSFCPWHAPFQTREGNYAKDTQKKKLNAKCEIFQLLAIFGHGKLFALLLSATDC